MIIQKNGKDDRDFDGIKWAISVRSKDIRREAICCVNMSEGVLCGTDGHRMHLYTPEREIENGNYEVITDTAKLIVLEPKDVEYPEYERVFPEVTTRVIDPIFTPSDKQQKDNLILNKILKNSDSCFNTKYLSEGCPCNESLFFEQAEGRIIIRNGDYSKSAIIMALSI